jgi:hypothetical protein
MRLFLAVTDNDWFAQHAAKSGVEEVNFWRPSPDAAFKALQPGEILLFKLKAPNDAIAGGGFFTRFLQLPINMAWETFGEANGVKSLPEFRSRIARLRNVPIQPSDNPTVGCIMLTEPFFWPKSNWIPRPPEFSVSNQVGSAATAEPSAAMHCCRLISPVRNRRRDPRAFGFVYFHGWSIASEKWRKMGSTCFSIPFSSSDGRTEPHDLTVARKVDHERGANRDIIVAIAAAPDAHATEPVSRLTPDVIEGGAKLGPK